MLRLSPKSAQSALIFSSLAEEWHKNPELKRLIPGRENRLPDPAQHLLEFSQRYRLVLPPSNDPIDFTRYSHLADIAQDDHTDVVVMAGAQTGKSSYMLSRLLRDAIKYSGAFLGYYTPTMKLASDFSTLRFAPFVRSCAALADFLGQDTDSRKGSDAVLVRTFGPTAILFLTTAGKTSTEGMPLKGVYLDEVRRMERGDIHRVMLRTEAQTDPVKVLGSTAGWPNSDIHAAFLEGTQNFFHTACKCPDGIVLAETFPRCIEDLKGASPERLRQVEHTFTVAGLPFCGVSDRDLLKYGPGCFTCPRCGTVLTHPRRGWWESHNEGAWAHSWQFPQMLSPASSAPKCAQQVYRPSIPTDRQELYNSVAGMPFIDTDQLPVNEEHLKACVNNDLVWAATRSLEWRRENLKNCAMGVDHMGGYICLIIKQLSPSGKYRDVHVEVVSGDAVKGEDAWLRVCKLMVEYDVSICGVEGLPNYNEALRFATTFSRRVFIVTYSKGGNTPIAAWKDRKHKPTDLKGEETGYQYSVHVNQARAMQWSLARWAARHNETPHPMGLIQPLPVQGGKVRLTTGLRMGHLEPVPIIQDVYWNHLTHTGFDKIPDPDIAERYSIKVKGVGMDPHFSFAGMMADICLSRIAGVDLG